MPAPSVRAVETKTGVAIHVDDAALVGFLSIFIDAKFQPGVRPDVLLSPWLEEVIAVMQRRAVLPPTQAPAEVKALAKAALDKHLRVHPDGRSRDELMRIALLPFVD